MPAASQTHINALIGDESWTATHTLSPPSAHEVMRIQTHLMFVHDRLAKPRRAT